MDDTEKIIEFVKANRQHYQVNFGYIKPKKRVLDSSAIAERMINLRKYQTGEIVIDSFYKSISRLV